MTALLELVATSVYRGPTPVVRDVSLTVAGGEVVELFGRNGSGRTTLLEGLAGLLELRGTARLDGASIVGSSAAAALRAGISLCPERRHLFASMTVRENLLLGGHSLPAAVAAERVREIEVAMPFLAERLAQPAGSLSGGEQQLLAMARACVSRPRLLLLDQPTAGQGPSYRDQVAARIRATAAANGAVLMAEDDLDFALATATRVVALSGGEIAFEVPVAPGLSAADLLDRLLRFEVAPSSSQAQINSTLGL